MKLSIGIAIITLGWANCSLAQEPAAINVDNQYNPAMTHMQQWAEYYTEEVTTEALMPLCKGWMPYLLGGDKTCSMCWNPLWPFQKKCH